jgi:hypothetical protein
MLSQKNLRSMQKIFLDLVNTINLEFHKGGLPMHITPFVY